MKEYERTNNCIELNLAKNYRFSLGFGEKLVLKQRGGFRALENQHDTKAQCFFSNSSIMRLVSRFCSILFRLGL